MKARRNFRTGSDPILLLSGEEREALISGTRLNEKRVELGSGRSCHKISSFKREEFRKLTL